MPINPKRAAALKLLEATGMARGSYAPPFVRLLWLCGIDVPPPHFVRFRTNAFISGAVFAVSFGIIRRLLEGPDSTRSLPAILFELGVIGALFGLIMAGLFERGKRKHRLPTWREL